ncbi:hypothetical protein HDU81_001184 [Chytriomyces hyalinus]|nr:hypothetical protein HDU81_001184 [Chytriomyces hyalinus]
MEESCRVCRSPASSEMPLFHPCRCIGSIKFVHQECLEDWLKHSRKSACDICGFEYGFDALYDPLAPASISIGTYFASIALVVIGYIEFALRAVAAAVLSLAVFPYLTATFWKMWFNAWPKKHFLTSGAEESIISSSETIEPITSDQEFAIIQKHVYEGYSILLFLACLVIFGISLLFLARHVVLNTHVDRDPQIVREDIVNDEDIALMNDRARANRFRRNLQIQREQMREQDRLAAEAAQQADNPLPQNLGENLVVGPDVRNVQQNRMAQPPPIEEEDDAPLPQPFTFDDLLRTVGIRGNIADMMLSFGIMLGAVIGLITLTAFGTFGPMTISVLLEWFILEVYMPRAAVIVGIATEFLQKVTDPLLDPLLDYLTAQLGLHKSNPEIIEAVADNSLKVLKWDAFDLKDYVSDDARHILSGYIVIGFVAYVYAKRVGALDHPYAAAAVKSIIGNLKVAFFIMMDFLVLRPYCGFLVDLCTVSVFGPNNTLQKRVDHWQSRPILFYFIYWITGTVTMFQFIQYIEIARKHVRPGLFWFTLDPANPQFNPLQRFRERSLWKGIYTVLFNAMICTVYVLSAVGGITGILHIFQLVFNLNDGPLMILPLRWEMRDPVSELSAVVIFVTVAFPLAKYLVEPKKRISHALKIYLRFASHKLRVTEFTLGERIVSEENGEVGDSDPLVVKELSVNDARPDLAPSVERKPYLRVPKHDQIVKLPGETIMIAMSRTDPLVGKLGETEADIRANWRRVYAPAQFRARIFALMAGQWMLWLISCSTILILSLGLGRVLVEKVFKIAQWVSLDKLAAVALPGLNSLFSNPNAPNMTDAAASLKWSEDSITRKDLVANDVYSVLACMAFYISIGTLLRWSASVDFTRLASNIFKASFVAFWGVFVIPLMGGVWLQFVVARISVTHHDSELAFFIQSWFVGLVMTKLIHFVVKFIPNIGIKRALGNMHEKLWETGIHELSVFEFFFQAVVPTVVSYTLLCSAFIVLTQGADWSSAPFIGTMTAIAMFTSFQLAAPIRSAITSSITRVRNEQYQVGRRLRNVEQ